MSHLMTLRTCCWYCGHYAINICGTGIEYDHVFPQYYLKSPVVPVCISCNRSKGQLDLEGFRRACLRIHWPRTWFFPVSLQPKFHHYHNYAHIALKNPGLPTPHQWLFWFEREGLKLP